MVSRVGEEGWCLNASQATVSLITPTELLGHVKRMELGLEKLQFASVGIGSSDIFFSDLPLSALLPLEQCQAPPPVRRAQIAPSKNKHSHGSTVHYTCEVGYELRGSAQRTCGTNGEWIGDEPSCGCQGQVSDTGEKNILFVFLIPTFS